PLRPALSPVGGSILPSFRGFLFHRVHFVLAAAGSALMAKLSPAASSSPRRLISSLSALHSASAPFREASAWPSASASAAFERLWKRDVVGRSGAWGIWVSIGLG